MGKRNRRRTEAKGISWIYTQIWKSREMLMPNGQQCATAQRTDEYYTIKVYAIDVFIV